MLEKLRPDRNVIIKNLWKPSLNYSIFFLVYLSLIIFLIEKFGIIYEYLLDWKFVLAIFVFIPLSYIYIIISIIRKILWYVRLKKYTENNMQKTDLLKFVKIKNILIDILSYIAAAILVLYYVDTLFPRGILYSWNLKLILVIFGLVIYYLCRVYVIFNVNMKNITKKALIIAIFVILTLGIYVFSVTLLDRTAQNPNDLKDIPSEYAVLRLSNFNSADELEKNKFIKTYSPIVPLHYMYEEYNGKGSVDTEYYKCASDRVAEFIYESVIRSYKNKKYLSVKIKSISPEEWKCDEGVIINDYIALLLKDDIVLEVSICSYDDLIKTDSDEFRAVVFKKFDFR